MNSVWPGAQHRDLLRLGLLDLQHQLGAGEHGSRVRHDARALRRELLVGDRAALARARLHEHLVPARGQLAHARRA